MTNPRLGGVRRGRVRRAYRRAQVDQRYDPLRTTRGRRLIVALVPLAAAFPLAGLRWDTGRPAGVVLVASIILQTALYIALRRATRSLAEWPEDVLDERELAQRDGAFRPAYRTLAAAALILFGSAYAASTFGFELRAGRLLALWLSLQAMSLHLPAAIIALHLPPEGADRVEMPLATSADAFSDH